MRTNKFYVRNEREVMRMLGLESVPGSGNGWVRKEDGENEHIVCQLKSTDKNSIRVDKKDVDELLYHAFVSHKLPLFVIQFLQTDELFLMVRPKDVYAMCAALEGSQDDLQMVDTDFWEPEETTPPPVCRPIKSSRSRREAWNEERKKGWKGGTKSAW